MQKPLPTTWIRNADLIITMDPNLGEGPLGLIWMADLLLEGDRIGAVGRNLRAHGATLVDASGQIIMPGFVDVHNHLHESLIRGCGTDQDLFGWLEACVLPMAPRLSEADTYIGVRLSTLDLISTGVTTVVDWSELNTPKQAVWGNIRALLDSGLRFVFAYTVGAYTDRASEGWDLKEVITDIQHVKQELIDPNPRGSLQVGSHPIISRLEEFTRLTALARELGVKLHVHLLENIKERRNQPMEVLKQAGALGPNLLAAHAIHLTDEEIALLAAHDVRIAHNPLSNMRLASGIIRLPELYAAGVKVGLGLDGGANDTSDMFNTMRVAVGLQRVRSLCADTFPTVIDVLRMATIGGAEVLDMEDQIGSLTPGKKADVIVLNPADFNFGPRFNVISQIVFNAQPANVKWVFVDGQPLKKEGQLMNVPPDIMQRAEEAAGRVKHMLEESR